MASADPEVTRVATTNPKAPVKVPAQQPPILVRPAVLPPDAPPASRCANAPTAPRHAHLRPSRRQRQPHRPPAANLRKTRLVPASVAPRRAEAMVAAARCQARQGRSQSPPRWRCGRACPWQGQRSQEQDATAASRSVAPQAPTTPARPARSLPLPGQPPSSERSTQNGPHRPDLRSRCRPTAPQAPLHPGRIRPADPRTPAPESRGFRCPAAQLASFSTIAPTRALRCEPARR
mgnify:CR=1 FL=1